MPLYSDSTNYYYSGGSSQLYSPYYSSSSGLGLSGVGSGTGSSYTSNYNRSYPVSYMVPLSPSSPRSPSSYTSGSSNSISIHSLGSRYQPKLTTITESSGLVGRHAGHSSLMPLTRIQSPKYVSSPTHSYSHSSAHSSSSRYIPPRPIAINTADIDVSSARYRRPVASIRSNDKEEIDAGKNKEKEKEREENVKVQVDLAQKQTTYPAAVVAQEPVPDNRQPRRSTIRRNRAVVRLSTIRRKSKERTETSTEKSLVAKEEQSSAPEHQFRDLPPATEPSLSWRQKLAEELASFPTVINKKSPGELLRERFFIHEDKELAEQQPQFRASQLRVQQVAQPQLQSDRESLAMEEKVNTQLTEESDQEKEESEQEGMQETIRRLSLVQCPTFHDICEDISSDKIDDDLNAGELRRRASIIQEQEQEILNKLQKSSSGSFQLIHLERRSSHDSTTADESSSGHRHSSKQRKKSKKLRDKITAIVEVQSSPSTAQLEHMPSLLELNEDSGTTMPLQQGSSSSATESTSSSTPSTSPKPMFTVNVEVEEHNQIHKIFKLPKKKTVPKPAEIQPEAQMEMALPEGFMKAAPKPAKISPLKKPKAALQQQNPQPHVSVAQIFTFDEAAIQKTQPPETKVEGVATPKPIRKVIQKSESGDDFWSQIGSRETLYMTNRKKAITERQEKVQEESIESEMQRQSKIIPTTPQLKSELLIELNTTGEITTTCAYTTTTTSPKITTRKPQIAPTKTIQPKTKSPPSIRETKKTSPRTTPTSTITTTTKDPIQLTPTFTKDSPTTVIPKFTVVAKAKDSPVASPTATPTKELPPKKSANAITIIDSNKAKLKNAQRTDSPLHKSTQSIASTEISTTATEDKISTPKTTKVSPKISPKNSTPTTTPKVKSSISATDKTPSTAVATTKTPTTPESPPPTPAATTTKKATGKHTSPKAKVLASGNAAHTGIPVVMTTTNAGAKSATAIIAAKATGGPKINSGQSAKSPEQQQATTVAAVVAVPVPATKLNKTTHKEQHQQQLQQPAEGATAPTTLRQQTEIKPKCTEIVEPTDSSKVPSPKTTKSKSGGKTNNALKKKSATAAPTGTAAAAATAAVAVAAASTPAATAESNVTPINADQFITLAPTKAAKTSPGKQQHQQQQQPQAKFVATNASSPAAVAATTRKTPTPTTTATAITIERSVASVDVVVAVAGIGIGIGIDIGDDRSGDGNDNSCGEGVGNILSKFATVSNLAQCLRDVDAELEDYIPSSAENSNDDSSDDYSSADGCANLSASMKKKQRKEKKKQKAKGAAAAPLRFDPHKKVRIDTTNKCYVKEEAPRYPLVATPRPLWKREKIVYSDENTDDESSEEGSEATAGSLDEDSDDESEECSSSSSSASSEESEAAATNKRRTDESDGGTAVAAAECSSSTVTSAATLSVGASTSTSSSPSIIRMSTCSNDSGFEGGTAPSSPKKMLETSYTYSQFQKSGRFTAPATVIPRFKNYSVDDFHFLAVLGKGSFGKVLLAELRDTTYYYAIKCLKKDVVLEDDDVDSTLIERKVLALGTKHPYLCHLFCTFQTESHLFFVMEYLNGGDLMFHIQESGRFSEERSRFYGAEIISGLKFLHKKGIIYRDLKLDNVLLDYEGHVRIADFGMCKLQIYLDKTADSFCGTPDYMAPEIIKGEKYNQNVDWWSFGVLLYEMLIGQSPFSGCDEDELFWSICNEIPWFPVYISAEATGILKGLLEKDYAKRLGSQYSPAGDIADHIFFRPIDWNLLEKRQIEPPFKPQVKHPLDTQYFDRVFTRERVRLTPIDKEILASMDQKQFHGFTYTNPHITLD
ncbi:uncharacterized protein LOC111070017 isoform X1 [Drosophila obscura]|uniref:uncharacterized protein LOC111070017 isoform X1 n=1 Tax=Drosophila obscura TaxID=7282 RepID=UPI000BA0BEC0|nr:uncharacterized protein LOC111070017 isoform X1 [Drosophila obscura]XP_022216004.1 uncharacterized protein LOC111070017 isoform X1 [Drosophila obscura]